MLRYYLIINYIIIDNTIIILNMINIMINYINFFVVRKLLT